MHYSFCRKCPKSIVQHLSCRYKDTPFMKLLVLRIARSLPLKPEFTVHAKCYSPTRINEFQRHSQAFGPIFPFLLCKRNVTNQLVYPRYLYYHNLYRTIEQIFIIMSNWDAKSEWTYFEHWNIPELVQLLHKGRQTANEAKHQILQVKHSCEARYRC